MEYKTEIVERILGSRIAELEIENAKLIAIIESYKEKQSLSANGEVKKATEALNQGLRQEGK